MNSEIVSFLKVLSNENIKITTNNDIIKFEKDKSFFNLKMVINETNMNISDIKQDINSMVLYGIIKKKEFNNINQLFDFVENVKNIIPEITNYCVGCFQKMEFQSDEYITCGKKECKYIYEELKIGNPVIDKIKDDPDITRFLLESAFDAILCDRKYDIFEPFPNHFMIENVNLKRGEMSKLTGKNYDYLKDFNKLTNLINKFNLDNFFNLADTCYDDDELAKVIGNDCYTLIRFIIMTCKIELVKDNSVLKTKAKGLNVYKIVHPINKEKEFKNISNGQVLYLFHGSRWHNWYSILRNGLKNCSETKLMTTGSVYGNGIYLSSNFSYSFNYGISGNKSVVGVFELAGNSEKYQKSNGIYVVDNEKIIIQRYLILTTSNMLKNINIEINKLFGSAIYEEKAQVHTRVLSKGIKKLVREYKKLQELDLDKIGFRIKVNPKDMYCWKIFIFGYDKNEPISKDMQRYNIDEIEVEVKFPENYPFSPPFLRVIKPRFQHLTGHVTSAGALCMQILTEKHWNPACSMESLIITIKSEILEGGGRLDPNKYYLQYSEKEAIESFQRVSRGHGWL